MRSARRVAKGRRSGLGLLAKAIERLRAEETSGLPGPGNGEELAELRRDMDSLHARFTHRLRNFDHSGAYANAGAPSAAGWLRSRCRLTPNQAAEEVRVARELPELAETSEAFAAGDISFQHAAVITRCGEEVGTPALRRAQSVVVATARQLDPRRLRLAIRHLRFCLDPEGGQAQANLLFERRALHLTQSLEGVFYLDGRLDAEGGSLLRAALEAIMGPRRRGDERSPAQRRADALEDLARMQLDAGKLPSVGGQRPHLTLLADSATLAGAPGAGELDDGQPLAPEAVRRIACDAAQTVVSTRNGEALSMGRTRRVVSRALRRALVVRDGGCRFPGCDRPACWTDAHHLVHWVDGGRTSLANTLLLCRPHHRRVHDEGWRLVREGLGGLRAEPP
jgi:uncharacterized protein DUF222